jgi:hypothetical protein
LAPPTTEPAGYTNDIREVRQRELDDYIVRRRQGLGRSGDSKTVGDTLVGLSLSGGGIRSATTNLGMLQALARMRVLPYVDYLSTVSGGGYIGGCLSALLSINRLPYQDLLAPRRRARGEQYRYETPPDLQFNTDWPEFPFNPRIGPSTFPPGPRAEEGLGQRIVAHLRTHGNFLNRPARPLQARRASSRRPSADRHGLSPADDDARAVRGGAAADGCGASD